MTGYLIESVTKTPIQNVKIGFLVGYKSGGMATELVYNSDKNGYFEIEALIKKTNYDAANMQRSIYSRYLKIEKEGFVSDTIFIENPKYARNVDDSIVFLDTIYLRPVKTN